MARITLALLLGPALLVAGCQSRTSNSTSHPSDEHLPSAAAAHPAMSVAGCLQEGGGRNDYILTHLNAPPIPVTGSSTSAGAIVARDDLVEARNAYRLEPQHGLDLQSLVGKQVRVTGSIADPAHLPSLSETPAATTGTSAQGHATDTRSQKPELPLRESELAVLSVTATSTIADSCDGGR